MNKFLLQSLYVNDSVPIYDHNGKHRAHIFDMDLRLEIEKQHIEQSEQIKWIKKNLSKYQITNKIKDGSISYKNIQTWLICYDLADAVAFKLRWFNDSDHPWLEYK